MKIWKVYMYLDDHDICGCDCFDSYEKAKQSFDNLIKDVERDWNCKFEIDGDTAISDETGIYYEISIEESNMNPGFEENDMTVWYFWYGDNLDYVIAFGSSPEDAWNRFLKSREGQGCLDYIETDINKWNYMEFDKDAFGGALLFY